MRALVTGASGFIGNHVARALLRHGYEVRALLRPSHNGHRRAELPPEAEQALGDVRDAAAVAAAADGCDAIFHVAALYDLWAPDPDRFYETNVGGTRTIMDVARTAGIPRVVYTSSVATVTPGGDERGFASPDEAHGHYKRSKILAERVALEYPNAVIVNPSAPVGWGDVRPTPTGKIVLDFLRGRLPAYMDTGLNLIDVEDVAEGHVLAFERGKPGQRYILGNENLTLYDILAMVAEETGRRPPRIKVPRPLAYAAAAVSELVEGRIAGRAPTVPLDGVRMAGSPIFFDPSRAWSELGLPRSSVRTALRTAAAWFVNNGYC